MERLDQTRYTDMFRMVRVNTIDLQDPLTLEYYREKGFNWIRRIEKPFHEFVRRPTVGCSAELYVVRHVDCVPIDSVKGQKLIHKICYF